MKKLWLKEVVVLAGMASLLAACSGGGSGSGESTVKDLTIEGSLSVATLSLKPMGMGVVGPFAGAAQKVRCVPGSGRLVAGEGDISPTTGEFSLKMVGMDEGASLGCWIFEGGVPSMPLAFGAAASVQGGQQQLLGYAPKAGATKLTLGTIVVDNSAGFPVAKVDASKIVDNGSGDKELKFENMTGEWKAAVVSDASKNIIHPCEMDELQGDALTACKAEWANTKIYAEQFAAKAGGQIKGYGLALWRSEEARNACGGRAGFSAAGHTLDPVTAGEVTNMPFRLDELTEDHLAMAGFSYSEHEGRDNCRGVPEAACKAITTCKGLVEQIPAPGADEPSLAAHGLNCVLNSLKNGGESRYYDFGNTCSLRLEGYDSDYGTGDVARILDPAEGCGTDQDCGLKFYPRHLFVSSELIISGNMGTASRTVEESDWFESTSGNVYCDILRTNTFTITQTAKNKATLLIEIVSVPDTSAGKKWSPECATNKKVWFHEELKGRKMLMNLSK